jgi:hypothetical protein
MQLESRFLLCQGQISIDSLREKEDLSKKIGKTSESFSWTQVMPEARASAKLVGITREKREMRCRPIP